MAEIEELETPLIEEPAPSRPRQILGVFIRPKRTMAELAHEDRANWLVPMVALTVIFLLGALISGGVRRQAALNAPLATPDNSNGNMYIDPEQQQEQAAAAQQASAGIMFTHVFPTLGALAGLWVGWLILGSVLHLTLTMMGSRGSAAAALNLTAWASLPLALRVIVQTTAMLATQQVINHPGLSGFIAADAQDFAAFVGILLRAVDLYLIWQMVLILLGVLSISGLNRVRAWIGVLVSFLLLLALQAVPGFVMTKLSGLSTSQPFFFF